MDITWRNPSECTPDDDLVLVKCRVLEPQLSPLPRDCELPVSSGDHGVGEEFYSVGFKSDDQNDWTVAGWHMGQDAWCDARSYEVLGFCPLPPS